MTDLLTFSAYYGLAMESAILIYDKGLKIVKSRDDEWMRYMEAAEHFFKGSQIPQAIVFDDFVFIFYHGQDHRGNYLQKWRVLVLRKDDHIKVLKDLRDYELAQRERWKRWNR